MSLTRPIGRFARVLRRGVAAGQVIVNLKTPWRDSAAHLLISPPQFMQPSAALASRPRLHLIRFGVRSRHFAM